MRVELKQWLRSHWGDMSANDRVKFPEQTLFLRPGGSGITSMRESIRALASDPDDGFRHGAADRLRQHGQSDAGPRHGAAAANFVEHGARRARIAPGEAGPHRKCFAFAGGRRGGPGDRVCGHAADLAFCISNRRGMAGVPIDASPSVPVLLFTFVTSLVTGIAFGIAPAWMATRVDPIEALRGANRSTARTGSLARKTLVVFQAALSLVLLSASGLLTAALEKLENQNFGFAQDRRMVVRFDPQAGRLSTSAAYPAFPTRPRFTREHSRRVGSGTVHLFAVRRQHVGHERLCGWAATSRTERRHIFRLESSHGRIFRCHRKPDRPGTGHLGAGHGDVTARGGHQ